MFIRYCLIAFGLAVFIILVLLRRLKKEYRNDAIREGTNAVFDYGKSTTKLRGVIIGDYKSDLKVTKILPEKLKELRMLEKATREILQVPELYSDIYEVPEVKIFEYANKNWQYFLIKPFPYGFLVNEGQQKVIFIEKSAYDNPLKRKHVYIHEYIHFISNKGKAMAVNEIDYINNAMVEAYTEMLCKRVWKALNEKITFKTRYDPNIEIADRLEKISMGVTTQIFFQYSKMDFLADLLPNWRTLTSLAKKREEVCTISDQENINNILDYYENVVDWNNIKEMLSKLEQRRQENILLIERVIKDLQKELDELEHNTAKP